MDLGRTETFERIGITELFGQIREFDLQFHDGKDWKTFYTGDTVDNLIIHLKKAITAQRVRILIKKTNGDLPSLTIFDLFA